MNAQATVGRFFISACVVVQSILLSPKYQVFIGDKEVFRYMGMLIMQGGVPYRDAFDHKPPFIYFLAALFDFLGPWGLWLATTLLVLAAALFFYQTCLRLGARFPIVYPLSFVILMRYTPVIEGGGLTREVTASLALIIFSFSIIRPDGLIFIGVLCSLIFFTQQNELPPVMPFALLALLVGLRAPSGSSPVWSRLIKKAGLAAIGGMIVCLAVVLYFACHGALCDFWNHAFVFNTAVYADPPQPVVTTIRRLAGYLGYYHLLYPMAFLTLLSSVALLPGSSSVHIKAIILASLSGLCMQLFSISLSNKYYGHYFISCIPYIVTLMLACGLFLQKILTRSMTWIVPAALMLAVCANKFEVNKFSRLAEFTSAHAYRDKYPAFYFSDLKALQGCPGSLYVFRNKDYLALNTDLRIIAPSIWIYDHIWDMFPYWDPDGSIFKGILNDLHTANTEYILDFSPVFPLSRSDLQNAWDRFINSRYAVAAHFDDQNGNRIWNLYKLTTSAIKTPEQ